MEEEEEEKDEENCTKEIEDKRIKMRIRNQAEEEEVVKTKDEE